jgi:O-antigen ligase
VNATPPSAKPRQAVFTPRVLVVGLAALLAAVGGMALLGHLALAAVLLLFVLLTGVSVYWPTASLCAFMVGAYLPDVLVNGTPRFAMSVLQGKGLGAGGFLLAGLRFSDIVLLAMLVASCILVIRRHFARDEGSSSRGIPVTVWLPACLFAGWLALEVVRNLGRFGAHAPGELRFEYLGLAVVPYLCIVARGSTTQRRLFWVFIVGTLLVPLALLPVIGDVKGWSVGATSRFFPASVSLGLFYGAGALVLAKARRIVATPTWLVAVVTAAAAVLVFIDGSRSVWMAGVVATIVAVCLRALPRRAVRREGLIVVGALVASLVVSWAVFAVLPGRTTSTPVTYLQSRSLAFVNPSADKDSAWRIAIWRVAFRQIRAAPVFGVGFGGYWNFPIWTIGTYTSRITLQPHDVYIQTWLKTGAIGLLLLLGSAAGVLAYVFKTWGQTRASGESLRNLLLAVGVITLISSVFYMVVYSFTDTTLLWTGLALGAAATQLPTSSLSTESSPESAQSEV